MDSSSLNIVICPGLHDPVLTTTFWAGLQTQWPELDNWKPIPLIVPARDYPVYSPQHVLQFLERSLSQQDGGLAQDKELLFISFSAGVVGAIGAARAWQHRGKVKAFLALDGWGVPLGGSFPIHRLSHDPFTDWSSAFLGGGAERFYADPPVNHLDLWRSPQLVRGWHCSQTGGESRRYTTAAQFLTELLRRYREIPG
jgi:hypothetical protein